MSIYRFDKTSIHPIERASFSKVGWSERQDLQALLRDNIQLIVPNGLVVSEEYCGWSEGKRRIDLLVVDRDRNLVVVELKRTDDGGHMELQALRYAAMISRMTFDGLVATYEDYLTKRNSDLNARESLLEWFGPEESDSPEFPAGINVCLVSADFSKEITTTALWLRDQGVEIRCVRFRPYQLSAQLVAEIEQVIPPPDTDELIVAPGRRARSDRKPWIAISLNAVYDSLKESDRAVARDLHDWLASEGATIFTTADGFAPKFPVADYHLYPLKIRRDGRIIVWFNYLKPRPPFTDESVRRELWDKLNQIPGVALPDGASKEPFAGRPGFDLSLLANEEARSRFKAAIAWAVAQARAAAADVESDD